MYQLLTLQSNFIFILVNMLKTILLLEIKVLDKAQVSAWFVGSEAWCGSAEHGSSSCPRREAIELVVKSADGP